MRFKRGVQLILTIISLLVTFSGKSQHLGTFSDYLFNSITKEHGLSQSSVLCLVQDNYGFIWMGTKYGLNKYDGYRFVSYQYNPSDSNSLQSNEIIYLKIDYHGDILIGNRGGGLNKYCYNQNKFVRIKGIPKSYSVNDLCIDNDSTLWVGTTQGLYKGKATDFKNQYNFKNLSANAIFKNPRGEITPSNKSIIAVFCIYKESANTFLLGTEDGILRFNTSTMVFQELGLNFTEVAKVVSIFKDKKGKLYIGSSEGLAIIDSSNQSQGRPNIAFYNVVQPKNHQLKVNWINQLILDKNQNLWGGTRGGGLFRIDSTGNIINYLSNNNNKGYISDNVINSLLIDKTGVLWIGTESRGCNTLDLNRKKFKHIQIESNSSNNYQNHQITAIAGNQKDLLWIGTAFNGITQIAKTENQEFTLTRFQNIKIVNNMPTNEIISLMFDHKQNLWLGMAINSIAKMDKLGNISSIPTAGFVFTIFQDRNQNIWYGTWGNGLGKVNSENNTITIFNSFSNNYHALSNDIVLALADDNDQNLWIGTKGGGINIAPIAVLTQGQSNFVNYTVIENDSASLSNNDINCILQDVQGTFWIGTSNGLNKVIFPECRNRNEALYQGKLQFKSYFEKDGLPNNVICGMLEDDSGNLWISTMNGLSKMDKNTGLFTNYFANDGLQANEFHTNGYYKSSNGMLFFGGVNGITAFNPNEIKPNPYLPEVVITSLKIFDADVKPNQKILNQIVLNQNITSAKSITLNHKHKEFSFEFSAMHFANTHNVKYMYRLLGFNDEWRLAENNEHTATYTNIFEGDYTFQVIATNNDGMWSNHIAQIQIKVKPPFWRTPVFYIFYFITILILLFFFRKYSLIAVTEKSKLKIEAFERNKMVEITESKMRFFTNISHEIRTPLTLIFSPLEKVIQQGRIDEESKKSLMLVKKNVSRLLTITNQLLRLRKIDIGILEPQFEKVQTIPYIKDILEYFEHQARRKTIQMSFSSGNVHANESIWIDKEMITTALYNLLSNAFKYSRSNGKIHVGISVNNDISGETPQEIKTTKGIDNWLLIAVKDNGIGISPKEINHIFMRFYQSSNSSKTEYGGSGIGLSIVKEYVGLHKGTVTVESMEGKGTTMKIYLPLGKTHINENQIKDPSVIRPPKAIFETMALLAESADLEPNAKTLRFEAETLVIVDDDADMVSFLKNHLSEKYHVFTALNGKDAWQIIQRESPQLVISDIMMPEMDGTELCDLVKQNIETSHIPVILLTAKAGDDNIIEGYEKGADRYISKPFSLTILEAQIAQLLATRKHLIDLYSKKILLKPRDITITSTDEKFLTKLMNIIEENLSDSEFDVAGMVDKMNMSHSAVLKKIKVLTNTSLVDFVRRHRLNKAAMIFQQDKLPINEVAYMMGFSDPKYFSKCFSKQFGMTPSEYISDFIEKKN